MSFRLDKCGPDDIKERDDQTQCSGQLLISWDPAGKREPTRRLQGISHSQTSAQSKGSPEKSTDWEEQGPRHQHVYPASQNIRKPIRAISVSICSISTRACLCTLYNLLLYKHN